MGWIPQLWEFTKGWRDCHPKCRELEYTYPKTVNGTYVGQFGLDDLMDYSHSTHVMPT